VKTVKVLLTNLYMVSVEVWKTRLYEIDNGTLHIYGEWEGEEDTQMPLVSYAKGEWISIERVDPDNYSSYVIDPTETKDNT